MPKPIKHHQRPTSSERKRPWCAYAISFPCFPSLWSHAANPAAHRLPRVRSWRSEEHTSELQSLMRISYAVFCLKKKKKTSATQKTKQLHNIDQSIAHINITQWTYKTEIIIKTHIV